VIIASSDTDASDYLWRKIHPRCYGCFVDLSIATNCYFWYIRHVCPSNPEVTIRWTAENIWSLCLSHNRSTHWWPNIRHSVLLCSDVYLDGGVLSDANKLWESNVCLTTSAYSKYRIIAIIHRKTGSRVLAVSRRIIYGVDNWTHTYKHVESNNGLNQTQSSLVQSVYNLCHFQQMNTNTYMSRYHVFLHYV